MSREKLRALLHRHADELADALAATTPADGDAGKPRRARALPRHRTVAASDKDREFAARELRRMDLLPARGSR